MVSRRQYVVGILGSASMLWYGLTQNQVLKNDRKNTNTIEAGSTITRSGTTAKVSEPFNITSDVILTQINATTDSDSAYEIYLIEDDSTSVKPLLIGDEPTNSAQERIYKLPPNTYRISTKGSMNNWNVEIKNYTSMPNGASFVNIPIRDNSMGTKVYGPIVVGPYPKTVANFRCETKSDNKSIVRLINGNNTRETTDIITIPPNSTTQKQFKGRLDGSGFVQVISDVDWELTIQKDPEWKENGEKDGIYEPV